MGDTSNLNRHWSPYLFVVQNQRRCCCHRLDNLVLGMIRAALTAILGVDCQLKLNHMPWVSTKLENRLLV